MKLINNWRDAPRMYSMWAFGAIATIQGTVLTFITSEQLAARILFAPTWTYADAVQAVVAFLAVSGGIGRLIAQEPATAKP